MKKYEIADLNKLYKEADEVDKEIFADQRSNLQLVVGEHYSRRNSRFWDTVREARTLSQDQKLRLTKNHIYKISKIRKNVLLSHAAGVTITAANESELQDQKSAELNKAVWEYAKKKHNLRKRTHEWVSDYFDIGEVATKIYFDPTAGTFQGYKQKISDAGIPEFEADGVTPVQGDEAIFSGDIRFEKLYAFNLLRSPHAKTMEESPYLIIRKVVSADDLMKMVKGDEDKEKMVAPTKDEEYIVFDSAKQNYMRDKGVTTLREYYFRPCPQYPEGYFYITVEAGVLWEGPLPYGIFPIVYQGHDEIATIPRHASPIKQFRPYQIEINRTASKISEHHITLGDDKLVLVNGSKLSKGSEFPGIRSMTVTGQAPTVIAGRSGEQYFPYLEQQISELYNIADIPEELEEKQGGGDAWGELFKSARHKKKFIIDAEKFEFFLQSVCETYLALAKHYFDDATIIDMVGRNERINISEFKNTSPQSYQITVTPMSDDMETMMGKQLMLNHILQYSSNSLGKEDIGKLIRLMPYANNEQSFDDFTLSYDRATNMILQLDRGQAPTPNMYDDGPYIIKRLTARMVQADFEFLDPQIQQNYKDTVSLYEDMEAEKQRKIQAAEADFIPTQGANIKVAWYIPDPTNKSRSIQATLPAQAIEWLVKRLEDQGAGQAQLQSMNNVNAMSEIAQKINQGQTPQGSELPPRFPGGM